MSGKAPQISAQTRHILNHGGQILLPFEIGDALITFQRWRLAELIEAALEEARHEAMKRGVEPAA